MTTLSPSFLLSFAEASSLASDPPLASSCYRNSLTLSCCPNPHSYLSPYPLPPFFSPKHIHHRCRHGELAILPQFPPLLKIRHPHLSSSQIGPSPTSSTPLRIHRTLLCPPPHRSHPAGAPRHGCVYVALPRRSVAPSLPRPLRVHHNDRLEPLNLTAPAPNPLHQRGSPPASTFAAHGGPRRQPSTGIFDPINHHRRVPLVEVVPVLVPHTSFCCRSQVTSELFVLAPIVSTLPF